MKSVGNHTPLTKDFRRSAKTSKGRLYEWEQALNDVNIHIPLPVKNPKKSQINVKIAPNKLSIYLNDYEDELGKFEIDESFWSTVVADESFWYLDGNTLRIELTKMKEAETWNSLFRTQDELNEYEQDIVKKQLLLERFGSEYPQFDFSNAEFTGSAPNPRTFLRDLEKSSDL